MQIDTERGLISVEGECSSAQEAREKGFSYTFTSHKINCDVYGKCLDDLGYRHSFVLVKR